MKVFVTGGTGTVGGPVVEELVKAGHAVSALARSEASADKVKAMGAQPVRGTHTDLDVLAKAAGEHDAVIHLAFNHEIAFQPGGMDRACKEDRDAIAALCDALVAAGAEGRTFMNTSGLLGVPAPDETAERPKSALMVRGLSEHLTMEYASKGLRVYDVRLSPIVAADVFKHPFVAAQVEAAKRNGFAGYLGDGQQRWTYAHPRDAARLYVAALTEGPGGKHLHVADDAGVSVKDVAEAVGKRVGVPARTATPEELESLGFVRVVMGLSVETDHQLTRQWTGWQPREATFLELAARQAGQ
ncbi:unnamed protein product [Parajaminaea phylloscopi]